MTRPHPIIVRVTPKANEKLRILAEHYRLPISTVARGMMKRGYAEWREDAKLGLLEDD